MPTGERDSLLHPPSSRLPMSTSASASASVSVCTRLDLKLLLQIAVFNIGSHYNSHALSSLSPEILSTFDATRRQYGALFSSEELATVLLCLASIVLCYTPLPSAALALTFAVCLSTALSTYAVTVSSPPSYSLLLASRFLFGFAEGLLTTVQGAILAFQFPKRVGTAFGFMLLTSRLSSFAGLTLPAILTQRYGLSFSLWLAVVTTTPPVLAALLYCARTTDPVILQQQQQQQQQQGENRPPFISIRSWADTVHSLNTSFPVPFWLACWLWVVFSGVVYTLEHYAVDMFSPLFHVSASQSSFVSSVLVLIAGLSSPAIGYYQDRLRNRATILFICSTLLCLGSLSLILCIHLVTPPLQLAAALCSLSLLSLAFAAGPVTLMASVAVVVPGRALPAALALYKACESAGLAFLHLAFGALRDSSGDYTLSLLMLVVLAVSGMVAAAYLKRWMPSSEYEALKTENEDEEW